MNFDLHLHCEICSTLHSPDLDDRMVTDAGNSTSSSLTEILPSLNQRYGGHLQPPDLSSQPSFLPFAPVLPIHRFLQPIELAQADVNCVKDDVVPVL